MLAVLDSALALSARTIGVARPLLTEGDLVKERRPPMTAIRTLVRILDAFIITANVLWMAFVAYGVYFGPALIADGALLGVSGEGDLYSDEKYAEKGEFCGLRLLGRGAWPGDGAIDKFLFVHAVSTLVGTVTLRDVRVVWFLSVMCEFIELTFAHMIPNFAECFWDSMFLDIFGTNMLGIILGYYLNKLLGFGTFDLLGATRSADDAPRRKQRASKAACFAIAALCVFLSCQGHLCAFVFKHAIRSKSKRWTVWWLHGTTHMALGRPAFEALYQRVHLRQRDAPLIAVYLFVAVAVLDWVWVVRVLGGEWTTQLWTTSAPRNWALWPLGFGAMFLVAYEKVSASAAIAVLVSVTTFCLVDLYGY